MLKTIDLTTKYRNWTQLEYLLVCQAIRHAGKRMVVVLSTTQGNHFQALDAIVHNIAKLCRNGRVRGSVTQHRLMFENGTELLIVGTEHLESLRGRVFDIVFLAKDAPQDVKNVVLPALRGEKPYLYEF